MTFRGVFRVDEPSGERWDLALEMLRAGQTVVLADVGLRVEGKTEVTVIVVSQWNDLSLVTPVDALHAFARGQRHVAGAAASSPEFRELLAHRRVVVEFVVDYDTGSVLIGRDDGTEQIWADGTPISR